MFNKKELLVLFDFRVMFGTTQMFGFSVPKQRDASKKEYPTLTFDMFQSEIATKSGFDMSSDNKSRGIYNFITNQPDYSDCD